MQQEAKQAKGEAAYAGKMVEDLSKRLAQAEHFVRQARRVQISSALRDLLNPDEPSTWMDDMPLPVLVSTAVQVDIIESHDSRQTADDVSVLAQQQQQGVPGRSAGRNAGREPRRSSPLATAALVSAARVKFTGSVSRYRNEQSSSGPAAASSAGPLRQYSEDSAYGSNHPSGMQSRNSPRQISRRQSMVQQGTADQDTDRVDVPVPNEASPLPYEAPTQSSQAHWQGQAIPSEMATSQRNESLVRQIAERCAAAPSGTSFVQQSSGSSHSILRAANQTATIVIPGRIAQPAGDPGNALPEAAQQDPAGGPPDSAAVLGALKDVVASRHPALSAWPRSRQEPSMYIAPLDPQANQARTNSSAREAEADGRLQPHNKSRISKTSPSNHGRRTLLQKSVRPRSGPQLSSSGATAAAAATPSPLQLAADVLIVDDGSRPPSRPGTRGSSSSSRPRTAGQFPAARPSRARRPMTPETDLSSDDAPAGLITLPEGMPSSASGANQRAEASTQAANQFQPLPARQKSSRPTSSSKQAFNQQDGDHKGSTGLSALQGAA